MSKTKTPIARPETPKADTTPDRESETPMTNADHPAPLEGLALRLDALAK
jgi:hypothetical protein